MLLGMKSIRSGEGEPARCSSCWEHRSAEIAVMKYGKLLMGGSIPVPKKESKPVEFQE